MFTSSIVHQKSFILVADRTSIKCVHAVVTYILFLQVKKDYLEGGAMADTADLVVLGAYYGTGSKGVLGSLDGCRYHIVAQSCRWYDVGVPNGCV